MKKNGWRPKTVREVGWGCGVTAGSDGADDPKCLCIECKGAVQGYHWGAGEGAGEGEAW